MLFFSKFSSSGRVWMEFGSKFFFFFWFSAYLIPFWLKIMPERGFLLFWFFFYLFRNFLSRVEYERNSGLKFFSLFLAQSHPSLYRNSIRIIIFNFFFNFLAIFFGNGSPARVGTEFVTKILFEIFFPGSSTNRIRD